MASRSRTSKPRSGTASARYDDVEFDFLNSETAATYSGVVMVRGDTMVLDIASQHGAAAILVEGHLNGHIYSGSNTLRREDAAKVNAKWTELGDIFVGVWIEQGLEYLFSFRLPKRSKQVVEAKRRNGR